MRKKNNKEDIQEVSQKRRKQGKENADISKGVQIANRAVEKEKRIKKLKEEKQEKNNSILKYIIIAISIFLVVCLFKYRHIIGITFSKEITEADAIVIETTTSNNSVYGYQNEILVFSKGSLATYSKYGKKTWEYTFEDTFIPEINTNGEYIQVVNKDGGYIYVFENKYECCRKKIDGKIKLTTINEKGQSAIYYAKEGVKSDICIFDKKGNEKYEVTLKTEQIADVQLSKNGRYLLIYEVETRRY